MSYYPQLRLRYYNMVFSICKPPINHSATHKPLDNKNNGTCYECYQFVIKRLLEVPQTRINTGFFKQLDLFKLGKSKDILKYICLSFASFLPLFYFCCIYYFGSLIFCCQFVAIHWD